jgi:hypothetical protein
VKAVRINGKKMKIDNPREIHLLFDKLPDTATVEIITTGGWPAESPAPEYPVNPVVKPAKAIDPSMINQLPDSLRLPYAELLDLNKRLADEPKADYERALTAVVIQAFESCLERRTTDPGKGYYREITDGRRQNIIRFYDKAALTMYKGLMESRQKRILPE